MLGILATYNVKGGVGKTTTSVNLAWLAAQEGFRTLLWDLDPQGGASYCLDVLDARRPGSRQLVTGKVGLDQAIWPTGNPNLHILPAARSYRNMDLHLGELDIKRPDKRLLKLMRPLSKHYDLLFIDCAPSISLVSENVFRAVDALLMPVLPNPLSMRAVEQVGDFIRRQKLAGVELIPFFSMVDRRKGLHREMIAQPPADIGDFAHAYIPYASEVEKMTVVRAPLVSYAPGSRAGCAFGDLWHEVKLRLGWQLPARSPKA